MSMKRVYTHRRRHWLLFHAERTEVKDDGLRGTAGNAGCRYSPISLCLLAARSLSLSRSADFNFDKPIHDTRARVRGRLYIGTCVCVYI